MAISTDWVGFSFTYSSPASWNFLAFFGYLFLWCLLTVVMAYFWGIIAGLAVTTGFHLLAAAAGFILFSRTHVTPIAPATAEELKTDLSCLQMALKKSSHS